ncbi:DUF2237 domain-containing protein [Pedococcus aerophilus]|uniref:DUF2237 domain-containing protein n=1 Tax=Pedococcus aerophilus TaxID=436356 RepID=A0ABP6H8V8_9MICO
MNERNVLGGELEPCGTEPMTGFFRDGCCRTGPEDLGSHTICAVATAEFLDHQRGIGNDLSSPLPEYGFPGLAPGDRWCVTALNWARAYSDGVAAPVVLASTHDSVLSLVPLTVLQQHAVDVPSDLSSLDP